MRFGALSRQAELVQPGIVEEVLAGTAHANFGRGDGIARVGSDSAQKSRKRMCFGIAKIASKLQRFEPFQASTGWCTRTSGGAVTS